MFNTVLAELHPEKFSPKCIANRDNLKSLLVESVIRQVPISMENCEVSIARHSPQRIVGRHRELCKAKRVDGGEVLGVVMRALHLLIFGVEHDEART